MKHPFKRAEPRDGSPVEFSVCPEVGFVAAGILAAQNCKALIRENVVEDVCVALNCHSSALDFLFADASIASANNFADDDIFDLPDAERRRFIIQNNNLNAAE